MRLSLRPLLPLALLAAAASLAACGEERRQADTPQIGIKGDAGAAGTELGFPAFATKNTTRVGGGDAVAVAAGVARAVFPAVTAESRPRAVTLVDAGDWRAGLAAAPIIAEPVQAPILFSQGGELPEATAEALEALQPKGASQAGDAQVIRVGDVPAPEGLKTTDLKAAGPAELAAAVDAFLTAARGRSSDRVLVVSMDRPDFAMPAAAWAAKSGDPILFVQRDRVPAATLRALRAHGQPKIYVLGPSSVIRPNVTRALRRLGTVRRVGGQDPVSNAVRFARYTDGEFGWGVVDPGHGLVFLDLDRPLDAAAAAPLSSAGTYGPALVHRGGETLPPALVAYLRDIQPGYDSDPVRGVYNHGWVIGDEEAMPVVAQAQVDRLLEILPVDPQAR